MRYRPSICHYALIECCEGFPADPMASLRLLIPIHVETHVVTRVTVTVCGRYDYLRAPNGALNTIDVLSLQSLGVHENFPV